MKIMVGLVAANFSDNSFGALTEERPLASLPIGGRYRMVDFPLSNMVNSGMHTVGLITPYMYRSLMDHVGVGKEWALSRKIGGMFILPGSIYGLKAVHDKFLLRDMLRNRSFFDRSKSDVVVINGCSKIFNIDFRRVVEEHEAGSADITLICKRGFRTFEGSGVYLETDGKGRVTGIRSEPGDDSLCFIDAFMINRSLLLNFMSWYEALGYTDLMDIIAENLDKVTVRAYEFDGYVGSVDGLKSYMRVSRELLSSEVREQLFLPERPISTKVQDSAPAKYMTSARVADSLVSTGCIINGTVEGSTLFRGVTVEEGAVLRNCVIMQNCRIRSGSVLENVICDKYVTIKEGVALRGDPETPIVVGKMHTV